MTRDAKRQLIEPEHPRIRVARQCELLGLPRSTYYYQSQGESPENVYLMRLLDEKDTDTPYYGIRRMTAWLQSQGYAVNRKRGARLMRTMGLETIYPKPRTTQSNPGHRIYPYLLRDVPITRVNQVWSTDMTFVRLHSGFVYLVAMMDWFSRYVLSWAVSITMDVGFCLDALEQALGRAKPDIFHSDQGSQFTRLEFTGRLAAAGIRISMDGRGRALDHVFVERLWRTVKQEEVYVKDYRTPWEATQEWDRFFVRYNERRQHQSLDYRTPAAVYFGTGETHRVLSSFGLIFVLTMGYTSVVKAEVVISSSESSHASNRILATSVSVMLLAIVRPAFAPECSDLDGHVVTVVRKLGG